MKNQSINDDPRLEALQAVKIKTAQACRQEMCDSKLWEFPHFYYKTESAIKFNPNRSCLALSRKTSTSSNTCVVEIMEAFLCTAHDRAQRRCCIQIQPWMTGDLYGCLEEASTQRHTKLAFSLVPSPGLFTELFTVHCSGWKLELMSRTSMLLLKVADRYKGPVSEQKCNIWIINTWQKLGKTRFYKHYVHYYILFLLILVILVLVAVIV